MRKNKWVFAIFVLAAASLIVAWNYLPAQREQFKLWLLGFHEYGASGDALNPIVTALALMLATAGYLQQRRSLKDLEAAQKRQQVEQRLQLDVAALVAMIEARAADATLLLANIKMVTDQLLNPLVRSSGMLYFPDGRYVTEAEAQQSLVTMKRNAERYLTERWELIDKLREVSPMANIQQSAASRLEELFGQQERQAS